MPADYHTHTPLCHHAEGEPEAFVQRALALGLSAYGISDHAPLKPEPFDDWRMLESDLPAYFDWVTRARLAADDKLDIRIGLECDWLKGQEKEIQYLRDSHSWDYLIGSVHYLDDWDFDNPKWLGRWEEEDVERVWSHYWRTYIDMIKSGLFDILGHADLIKKFAYVPTGNLARFYDPVIEAIVASGATIELNTAGWHKPCNDAYPAFEFLQLAAQANISLVISSDAHAPHELGRDFPRAIALAKAAGFTHTALFKAGKRSSELL